MRGSTRIATCHGFWQVDEFRRENDVSGCKRRSRTCGTLRENGSAARQPLRVPRECSRSIPPGRSPIRIDCPRASSSEARTDAVHDWLNDALDWRESVASSADPESPLPEDLWKRLDQEPLRHQTYGPHQARASSLIDSFLRCSPILDSTAAPRTKPTVRSDAIDRLSREIGWTSPTASSASVLRDSAADLRDRISQPGLSSSTRFAGLKQLVDMLPGLDPAFIDETLGIILEPMGRIVDPASEALLMERTLQITSHFQLTARWPDLARHLTARLERLLAIKRNPQELEPVVSSLCLAARWMRRL